MGILLLVRICGSVLDSLLPVLPDRPVVGDGCSVWRIGESGMDCRPCRRLEIPCTRDGDGRICCLWSPGCNTDSLAGGRAGGGMVVTVDLLGLDRGVWNGVWTPEKSPTAPQCTLAPSWALSGAGERGAGGRFTVVGGVSLRDTEHWTAPDLTSFLWVLQILLYWWLTFLGGAGLVMHTPVAGLAAGGWEAGGTECLWDWELDWPFARSSLHPSLLLSVPSRPPPRVLRWANVTMTWALSLAPADQAQSRVQCPKTVFTKSCTEVPLQWRPLTADVLVWQQKLSTSWRLLTGSGSWSRGSSSPVLMLLLSVAYSQAELWQVLTRK